MKHQMRLNSEPFAGIKSGAQQIESRLYDAKRQQINVGDEIEFSSRETDEKFTAHVVEVLRYPTFNELFSSREPRAFGGKTTEELLAAVYQYYSPEDEKRLGVVGIKLRVIPATN